jgi:hypothetical protein
MTATQIATSQMHLLKFSAFEKSENSSVEVDVIGLIKTMRIINNK